MKPLERQTLAFGRSQSTPLTKVHRSSVVREEEVLCDPGYARWCWTNSSAAITP
jgi:hypothetical protein